MTLIHRGKEVSVSGIDVEKAVESDIFKDWLSRLDPYFKVQSIEIQSVDYAGKSDRVLFLKLKAYVLDPYGKVVPGVVFFRGGAVAILLVLRCEGKRYTLLVNQPRLATGYSSLPELPAGMLDGAGGFSGVAARELQEEVGLTIKSDELSDLHKDVRGDWPGMYPSPGALEEFIRLFYYERDISVEQLAKLEGKETGLASENEKIRLSVIPFEELPQRTPDSKALSAYCLYQAFYAKK